MKCPHCGYEGNKPHQKKCALCGEPLEEGNTPVEQPAQMNEQPASPAEVTGTEPLSKQQPCPKCGTLLPEGTKFCPNCGHDMSKPVEEEQPSSHTEEPKQESSRQSRFWGKKDSSTPPRVEEPQTAPESVPSEEPQPVGEPHHDEDPYVPSIDDEEQMNVSYDYDDEESKPSLSDGIVIEPTPAPSQGTSWLLPLIAAILSLAAGAALYVLTQGAK